MTGKKALEEYIEIYVDKKFKGDIHPTKEWYLDIIKQDLERYEVVKDNLYLDGKYEEVIKMKPIQIEENWKGYFEIRKMMIDKKRELELKKGKRKKDVKLVSIKGEYDKNAN
jgi:hypothetical protein